MNKNIDLTRILKGCPKGTELYSPIFGTVYFHSINDYNNYPIIVTCNKHTSFIKSFTSDGRYLYDFDNAECMLFPSKDNRDWSKFTAPLYKKEKFDPKTLNPFDKVLVRDSSSCYWDCDFFSRIDDSTGNYQYITVSSAYISCIPYNEETKHLVGTKDEAPEFYKYWKD